LAALLVKVTDKVGNAMGDNAGFAATGASQNEQRTFNGFSRFSLGGIEFS
jgi:hypothetical protein